MHSSQTIVGIQYLRAIAAGFVALYHAMSVPFIASYCPHAVGVFGVDLFFVVSGYIMWTTTMGKEARPLSFWSARIVRIVPLYWTFTTLFLGVALLLPSAVFNAATDPVHVIKSYLFVPAFHPKLDAPVPVYTLGWTLNYEMFFYFVFGLCLIIKPRALRLALTLGILIALVLVGQVMRPDGAIASVYTDPLLLEFCAGIALAAAEPRARKVAPSLGWMFVGVAVMWLVIVHAMPAMPPRWLAFGLPAALTVAGALVLEPLVRSRPSRIGLLLGDASYSIYLAHPFAQRLFTLAASKAIGVGSVSAAIAFTLFSVAIGIAGGVVSFFLIEKPMLSAARQVSRAPAWPQTAVR